MIPAIPSKFLVTNVEHHDNFFSWSSPFFFRKRLLGRLFFFWVSKMLTPCLVVSVDLSILAIIPPIFVSVIRREVGCSVVLWLFSLLNKILHSSKKKTIVMIENDFTTHFSDFLVFKTLSFEHPEDCFITSFKSWTTFMGLFLFIIFAVFIIKNFCFALPFTTTYINTTITSSLLEAVLLERAWIPKSSFFWKLVWF